MPDSRTSYAHRRWLICALLFFASTINAGSAYLVAFVLLQMLAPTVKPVVLEG